MRRYLPVFFLAFFILVVITAFSYLPGVAGKNKEQRKNIIVYTSLSVEPLTILAQEYEKGFGVRVSLVVLPEQELLSRLTFERTAPKADLILAASNLLDKAKAAGLLTAYSSEQTEAIPARFRDKELFWVGIWYDPVVFAANQEYLKNAASVPNGWNDLSRDGKTKIALTDFLASDAAANLLYGFAVEKGKEQALQFFQNLHPQVVQYAKFLATPVRMAGMGETDIAIAVHSVALHYANEGFPIRILYPQEGTSYTLVGAGIGKKPYHNGDAKKFVDWLLQEQAHRLLRQHKFYFIPTNPESVVFREYKAKEIKLFSNSGVLSDGEQKEIFDKWVQTVRMVSK